MVNRGDSQQRQPDVSERQARQHRAAVRTVWLLALVSAGFYLVFFVEHYFFH